MLACERLGCSALARSIADQDASLRHPHMVCSMARARVAAAQGDISACLDALTNVVLQLEARLGRPQAIAEASAAMVATLSQLISTAGMSGVQAVLERSEHQVHPVLFDTVELAFERGTDGCES